MTITVKGDLTTDFLNRVLPKFIMEKIRERLDNTPNKKNMETYLKSQNLPSISEVLDVASRNIFIYTSNHEAYSIDFDNDTMMDNIKLVSLLKLIEYGNINVGGLHMISYGLKDVQENVPTLYNMYELGGI